MRRWLKRGEGIGPRGRRITLEVDVDFVANVAQLDRFRHARVVKVIGVRVRAAVLETGGGKGVLMMVKVFVLYEVEGGRRCAE